MKEKCKTSLSATAPCTFAAALLFQACLRAFICTFCRCVCVCVYVCMCADMYICKYLHVYLSRRNNNHEKNSGTSTG